MRIESLSSALAPVALIGGFTLGAAQQPARYDSVHDTISALAARGAHDRWIMSAAFVLLGLCHVVTAANIRRSRAGRVLLAAGGLATMSLALAPQPAHGSSGAHVLIAAIALIALAVWPSVGVPVERWAAVVLAALLVWFAIALHDGAAVGLAERVLTVAQAVWPICAVALARRAGEQARSTR